MTLFEKLAGVIVCGTAFLAIFYMIVSGFRIAMDAVRDDARRASNLRAHRLADRLYRDRIKNTRLNITQKLIIVEDDLYESDTAAESDECDLGSVCRQ